MCFFSSVHWDLYGYWTVEKIYMLFLSAPKLPAGQKHGKNAALKILTIWVLSIQTMVGTVRLPDKMAIKIPSNDAKTQE